MSIQDYRKVLKEHVKCTTKKQKTLTENTENNSILFSVKIKSTLNKIKILENKISLCEDKIEKNILNMSLKKEQSKLKAMRKQ